MTEIAILRVEAPYFCAGIVYERGPNDRSWRLQRYAPIFEFAEQRHSAQIMRWAELHGYRWDWITS